MGPGTSALTAIITRSTSAPATAITRFDSRPGERDAAPRRCAGREGWPG